MLIVCTFTHFILPAFLKIIFSVFAIRSIRYVCTYVYRSRMIDRIPIFKVTIVFIIIFYVLSHTNRARGPQTPSNCGQTSYHS